MLAKRVLVAVILLPIGLVLIFLGGWAYTAFIALILALAAAEFARLFRMGGNQPADYLMIGAAALLALGRGWKGFALDGLIAGLFILACMTVHLVSFRARPRPGRHRFHNQPGRWAVPGLYRRLPGFSAPASRRAVVGAAGPAGSLVGRYRGILYRPFLWQA